MLDRIDLHVEVPPVQFSDLSAAREGESSAEIRARVVAARERQFARFGGRPTCNARMQSRDVRRYCQLDSDTLELLRNAMSELGISARAYDRILKVARTIADLADSERLNSEHVLEAIQLRSLDRQIWG
jgi:magnesium chelatase family protein